MTLPRVLVLLACLLLPFPAAADGCGTPEGVCEIEGGFYRLALPQGAAGPVPAMVFLHGWNASSEGVMKNAALREAVLARGYALIAPEGSPRREGDPLDWSVRDMMPRPPRDDMAFLAAVIGDAGRRGADRGRILMAGFSRGGSMVWDIACLAPGLAAGFAPVSGAFWEPLPDDCNGPVSLFHTHGWTDRVVPLEGRILRDGRLIQGDAFASLAILRDMAGCRARMPETTPMEAGGKLWFRHWTDCPGGRIDLMLHPGGHALPEGWAERALDWFEALE